MTIRDWEDTERKADDIAAPALESEAPMTPRRLVELFSDDVWRYVSSKLRRREDAEDAAMETYAAAIRDFHRLKRADSPRLWLLGIARHKVHDAMRRTYRRAETELHASFEAPEADPADAGAALREAMASLPEMHREVLVLKYVNGLSTEEVARVIGKSAAATNSLLQRARESLRTCAQPLIEAQGGHR